MEDGIRDAGNRFARNVLLGGLRGPEQLDINVKHRFYHVPARLMIGDPAGVEYIAIYQSKRFFGTRNSGIRLMAKVESIRPVPRGEIAEIPTRNPTELYCRFDTAKWESLDTPIRARGPVPTSTTRTSLFLLQNSRDIAELYIADEGQYQFYQCLREAASRSRRQGGAVELPGRAGFRVLVYGGDIGIYSYRMGYHRVSLTDFYRNPCGFLQEMHKFIQINPENPVDFSN